MKDNEDNENTRHRLEKIFAKHVFDHELVSKISKKLKKFNNKETNNPIIKWAYDLKRQLTKENMQMANKHSKRCSKLIAIIELPIKIILRYNYTHKNG